MSGDRLLRAAARHSGAHLVALGALAILSAAGHLLLPAALGHTLDQLLTARPDATRWVLLCVALLAALAVCDAGEEILTGTVHARGAAWLRASLIRHVLAVGPRATSRFAPGDLVARMVGNAAHAGIGPATAALLLAALAAPLGAVVALGLIDLWLAVVFLAGAPVLALLLRAFTRASSDCLTRYQQVQGDLAARLAEAVGGARTIAAAGTADRERDRILRPLPELARQGHRMWQVQGRAAAQTGGVAPLLQLGVVATAGLQLAHGRLTVGELFAASRYAVLAAGVGVLVGYLSGLVRARTAGHRLAEVLAEPATEYGDRELPPGTGALTFRGVSVQRAGRTVLSGVDLRVPGGATYAVAGASGSGKSLLAALAGRLADPDEGEVLLDGVPLRDLTHAQVRAAVAYAFERPALLGDTLAGTIALGADLPRDAVVRAARSAHADDFVRRLPRGYDTPCADAPLSGGEVQRLGLARAFAHDGRLLVLDDALSSLDTVTERDIAEALLGPTTGRTRLIVAHRATTAARADQVVWLADGRVCAVGPHEELWQLPAYRKVFGHPAGESGRGPGQEEDLRA
ncbi:ABC transporter ATP-binding protein [Streptomyces monticola]|uniref:ABC transporter ATP-binding protein n=1 Tax=Streptomyces monticola TaxID=2666263 RepID=A0ABW2JSV1_9ACTN